MFKVTVSTRWADIRDRWMEAEMTGHCTPFQQSRWVEDWLATIGAGRGIEPLLVAVHESDDLVLLMPFVRSRIGRLDVIEPADLGVTDYNAPLLATDRVVSPASASAIWRAIRMALPPADLIRITKMPGMIDGFANPLCLLPSAGASTLNGNMLNVTGSWSDYHQGFERTFRKEIERSWRVFEKLPAASFEMISEPSRAHHVLQQLEQQQADRMAELGKTYLLDRPGYADHYHHLVNNGLGDGSVRLSALVSGDDVVAALLGITHGSTFAMVRISTGGNAWRNCSPGRLVIYKTMEALHGEGLRHFDYTIGDYAYKRRMGAMPLPLFDLVEAGSIKGWPTVAKERLRARLRQNPTLQSLRARLKRA